MFPDGLGDSVTPKTSHAKVQALAGCLGIPPPWLTKPPATFYKGSTLPKVLEELPWNRLTGLPMWGIQPGPWNPRRLPNVQGHETWRLGFLAPCGSSLAGETTWWRASHPGRWLSGTPSRLTFQAHRSRWPKVIRFRRKWGGKVHKGEQHSSHSSKHNLLPKPPKYHDNDCALTGFDWSSAWQ